MPAEQFHVTNHVERGLSRLISQYRGKPRIEGLLTSYLEEIQELSDQMWLVILSRMVDYAEGYHLRVIGKIVGQVWKSEDDARYRTLVRARIAVNHSSGTVNDMLRIAKLLTGHKAELIELFHATMLIDVGQDPFGDTTADMLHEARAGGVALSVQWSDDDEADSLTFADGDAEEDDIPRGLGGDDPDVGPGGTWAGVV